MGCPLLPSKVDIVLVNNSYDTLFTNLKVTYEDTLFFKYPYDSIKTYPKGVFHNYKTFTTTGEDAYDYKSFFCWSDTISIFILRYSTLRKFNYDEIRESNRILARYDVSLQDVEAFDAMFEYPPSQQMIDSGMKIYINPDNPDL